MTLIGFSGHQTLSDSTRAAVADAIETHLHQFDLATLEGVCSLAVGADQIFAGSLLAAGGQLHVVVPCENYADTFATKEDFANYRMLLNRSVSKEVLPYPSPTEEAFMAAGREVVERCEVFLAVWDGGPSAGLGGTADVVHYAQTLGKATEIIWPTGAMRA